MNDPEVALAQKAGWLLFYVLVGLASAGFAVVVDRLTRRR